MTSGLLPISKTIPGSQSSQCSTSNNRVCGTSASNSLFSIRTTSQWGLFTNASEAPPNPEHKSRTHIIHHTYNQDKPIDTLHEILFVYIYCTSSFFLPLVNTSFHLFNTMCANSTPTSQTRSIRVPILLHSSHPLHL